MCERERGNESPCTRPVEVGLEVRGQLGGASFPFPMWVLGFEFNSLCSASTRTRSAVSRAPRSSFGCSSYTTFHITGSPATVSVVHSVVANESDRTSLWVPLEWWQYQDWELLWVRMWLLESGSFSLFENGSGYVVQTGLEPMTLPCPIPLKCWVTGVSHCAEL